jgi:hypothetical protein
MIDSSKPVRVFKNSKHGCYNIMQNGKIKASAKQIWLKDVEFLVRESGRQRMLRERRKNIHAYVVGELLDFVHPEDAKTLARLEGRNATYNPYRFSSFVDRETEAPLKTANMAQLDERGVTYC